MFLNLFRTLLLACGLLTATHLHASAVVVPDKIEPGTTIKTVASFYHDKFEGRPTSSGETFSQEKLTFAVPERARHIWCLGTKVRISRGDRWVVATANDTGRFARLGRGIDVSKRIADWLGFEEMGTGKVTVTVLKKGDDCRRVKNEKEKEEG